MGLFTKKEQKETIPEIPPAPQFADFADSPKLDSPGLPLPPVSVKPLVNSSEKKGESGVASSPAENFEESIPITKIAPIQPVQPRLPILPKPDVQERPPLPSFMQAKKQVVPDLKPLSEEPSVKISEMSSPQEPSVKKDFNETIFIRIDKFNSAKRDLEEVERDLKQIEDVLVDLNEVKEREDEEINALNKNIEEIKSKLSSIDSDIFNRI